MRLDEAELYARRKFAEEGIATPALDSRHLLCGLLDISPAQFFSRGDMIVTTEQLGRIRAAIDRRCAGEPVHRILGRRSFRALTLELSPGTLEPRPDTEILVDMVLPFLVRQVKAGKRPHILDLGTGTGAILLALVNEVPEATGVGVDLAPNAVETARLNALKCGLEDVNFLVSDWFSAIDGQFDLIVSNPPYIPSACISGLEKEVKNHDPLLALDGGTDGLEAYRRIACGAKAHLAKGGLLAFEHGYDQKDGVREIMTGSGYHLIASASDYAGHDRAQSFNLD